jgi:hypothetical protein
VKIYKIWSNEGIDQAVIISPPAIVFKSNPLVGDTWVTEVDIGPIHFKGTHYVESTTDSVTIAAGSFNNCIRVRTLGESTEGDATVYEYEKTIYAPGVGPIIYRDYTENWITLDFSQELVSFSISTETGKTIPGIPLLLLDD